MKYWEVKMKSDRVGELLLYGPISDAKFWGDEVTPTQIDKDLKALGELDALHVRINSGGGSVFAGQAIYNIIKRHSAAEKIAYVDGLAASMASIIPMACSKIIMPANSLMMVHKPWAMAIGNADELRARSDLLDKIEGQQVDVYQEKTGKPREEIHQLLTDETWMTAQEALDLGFIDEIEQDIQIAASIDGDFLVFGSVKVDPQDYKDPSKLETYRAGLEPLEPVANKILEPKLEDPAPGSEVLAEQAQEFYRLREKIYKTYEEDGK